MSHNVEYLEEKIRNVCEELTSNILKNATIKEVWRILVCLAMGLT